MIGKLGAILFTFQYIFPRKATHYWFVITILGFIVRLDRHGVSSTVRWLKIPGCLYETYLAFFRSEGTNHKQILKHWLENVVKRHATRTSCGQYVLMGDGIKIAKESRYMPGVKKLHQESDNSGKSDWIFGHHFGTVGILAGNNGKEFCVPLNAELHEGAAALRELQGKEAPVVNGADKTTVITLMANSLADIAKKLNDPCVSAADAYFASADFFNIAKAVKGEEGQRLLHVIVRGKKSCVAYDLHTRPYCGKGRPPKYGKRYKLNNLFQTRSDEFLPVTVNIYGETKTIQVLCLNLWWKPFNDILRFVLIKDGQEEYILMCSDLNMSPAEIITIYSKRFKIEVTFKTVKHIIGGFCYHFWTKSWPTNKGKSLTSDDLKDMTKDDKRLVTDAMNAIEAFVNFAMISTGLLQILAVENAREIISKHRWWMRTSPSDFPSEEMVQKVIQHDFYHNFYKFKHTDIYTVIRDKRQLAREEHFKKAA